MKGLSSGKSVRDDPDVAVAEALPCNAMQCSASGSRLSDFSGKQPLHPWLSLTEQCFVAEHQSLSQSAPIHPRRTTLAFNNQVAGEKKEEQFGVISNSMGELLCWAEPTQNLD